MSLGLPDRRFSQAPALRPQAPFQNQSVQVGSMLGEQELIRLIEANGYPAKLVDVGLVWVELEFQDGRGTGGMRQRGSKSAFADLILDWRGGGAPNNRPPPPPPPQNR